MVENTMNTPIVYAFERPTDAIDRPRDHRRRARGRRVASEYGPHANRYVRHRYHLQDLRGPDRARAATRAPLGRGSRRGRGRDRRAGRGTLRERARGSMGRIDEDDEDAWGTRARGDAIDGEEFVSSNATGGSARARSAARDARDDGVGAMGAIAGDRYASVSWWWIDLGG